MTTAHEQWLQFADSIGIGEMDPKSVQYVETRRAFYGGMLTTFSMSMMAADRNADSPDGEREAATQMHSIYIEVCAFVERLKKGIA